MVARAFSGEQDVGSARGVRTSTRGTGNIARAPLVSSSAISNIGTIFADLAEDKEKRLLGRDLDNARKKVSGIMNPIQYQVQVQNIASELVRKHGAKSTGIIFGFFSQLRKPTVRPNIQKGTLEGTTAGGETFSVPLSGVTGNQGAANAITQTHTSIGARFRAYAPETNKTGNKILEKVVEYRKRQGLPPIEKTPQGRAISELMISLANPISSIEKAAQTVAAWKNTPGWENYAGTQQFANQAFGQAVGQLINGVTKFYNGEILSILANRRAWNVTAGQLASFAGQYVAEAGAAIQRAGAIMGMDPKVIQGVVQQLTTHFKGIQDIYESAYAGRSAEVSWKASELRYEMAVMQSNAIKAWDAKLKREYGVGFFEFEAGVKAVSNVHTILKLREEANVALGGSKGPRSTAEATVLLFQHFNLRRPQVKRLQEIITKANPTNLEIDTLISLTDTLTGDRTSGILHKIQMEKLLSYLENNKEGLLARDGSPMTSSKHTQLVRKIKKYLAAIAAAELKFKKEGRLGRDGRPKDLNDLIERWRKLNSRIYRDPTGKPVQ